MMPLPKGATIQRALDEQRVLSWLTLLRLPKQPTFLLNQLFSQRENRFRKKEAR
jgi:hypothetical protein